MPHRLRLLSVPHLATRLLPLAALLAQPCLALAAQQDPAQREALRRQSLAQEADSLAAEAQAAAADGRLAEAVNRYRAALDRLAPSAAALAPTRVALAQQFAQASVAYAQDLAQRGELDRARQVLQAALDDNAAPGFPPAQALLRKLDDPDFFNPAQSPAHSAATKKIRDLFRLAEGMRDIADFRAAQEAYNQILAVDDSNTAARRGLEQVEKSLNDHLRAARDHTRVVQLNQVDRQWESSVPASARPPGGSLGSGQSLSGGEAPSSARRKMQSLVLDRVAMSDSPIQEALTYLAKKTIELDAAEPDPNLKGVNIVFNPGAKPASEFKTVTLDLRNSSLGDALRALADLTGTRLSVEGNTITVAPLGLGSRIVTRTFRVPPGFLSRAGSSAVDAGSSADPFAGNADAKIDSGLKISRLSAKDWLIQNGVAFPEGTSADYSAGSNQLIVRNSEENLDLVQTVVDSTTDKTQRQVKVTVVLLKAEQKRLQEIGYDWLLGTTQVGANGVFASGGTTGNSPNAGNPADFAIRNANGPIGGNPLTAGLRGAFDLKSNPTIDDLIANGAANARTGGSRSPGILSTAGVFTSPQFQGILRGLDQKSGIDLSIGQTIILKAGQRASAASLRTIRYPTEFDPPQIPQTVTGGPIFQDLDTGELIQLPSNSTPPVTPTTPQSFEDKDTGSSIEVEATVGDDGSTVDLNLSVVFREFDGFINFGTPITSGGQVLTDNNIFQPVFSAINESAQVQVYDGETITIGGLSDSKYETLNDKVPLLGDLPFIGRLFRSEVTQVSRKAAIYFVTVKVVDPAGVGIKEAAAAAEQASAAPPGP